MKGLFIPGITAEMFRSASLDGVEALMAEGEFYDIEYEPERKTGRWIDKSNGIEGAWNYCSVCGEQAIDLYDFCPNCGAKMEES